MPRTFKRSATVNTKDERGTVQVRVVRTNAGRPVRGNISKTVTVAGSTVTEVYRIVESALFTE